MPADTGGAPAMSALANIGTGPPVPPPSRTASTEPSYTPAAPAKSSALARASATAFFRAVSSVACGSET